jgi:hypothetical protein
LGTHPVILTVPETGISSDRLIELQNGLTTIADTLQTISEPWYINNTNILEIELKDSGEYEYISKYKFKMNKNADIETMVFDHSNNAALIGILFKQVDTSKETGTQKGSAGAANAIVSDTEFSKTG